MAHKAPVLIHGNVLAIFANSPRPSVAAQFDKTPPKNLHLCRRGGSVGYIASQLIRTECEVKHAASRLCRPESEGHAEVHMPDKLAIKTALEMSIKVNFDAFDELLFAVSEKIFPREKVAEISRRMQATKTAKDAIFSIN